MCNHEGNQIWTNQHFFPPSSYCSTIYRWTFKNDFGGHHDWYNTFLYDIEESVKWFLWTAPPFISIHEAESFGEIKTTAGCTKCLIWPQIFQAPRLQLRWQVCKSLQIEDVAGYPATCHFTVMGICRQILDVTSRPFPQVFDKPNLDRYRVTRVAFVKKL